MKRFRLLPSVLMLVLCIGVLAVGIYAAAPMANNVTGTISVKSSGAEVTLEAWFEGDDSTYQKREKVRTMQEFTFSAISIDFSNAKYLSDVPRQKLRIKITNHSGKELGAYFFDEMSATEIPTQASHDNILREDEFTSTIGGVETTIVGVDLTSYAHIGVASTDSSVITDEATLSIYFTPEAWAEEDASFTFNYKLVIEEYKPNVTTTAIPTSSTTQGEATTASNFIKLSSTVNGSARASITRATGFYNGATTGEDLIVVVPNNVTMLGVIAFNNCSTLSAVTLPNSLTQFENDSNGEYFRKCVNLKLIEIPIAVTLLKDRAFEYCSSLSIVNFASNDATIGMRCFSNCTGLLRLDFLDRIISVGLYSFISCPVEKVFISSKTTTIGNRAFDGCENLQQLVVNKRTSEQVSLSVDIANLFDSSYTYAWTDGTSEVTTFVSSTEKDMVYTRVG